MSQEEQRQGNQEKKYEPLKLHNNVWFSPFTSGKRSFLSVFYDRDGLILEFGRSNPDGKKDKISKRIDKAKIEVLNKLLIKFCADRINLLTKMGGDAPNYTSTTFEDGLKVNNMFYSKKDNRMVDTGAISIHTEQFGNFQRAAITAIDTSKNLKITVILAEGNGDRILEQKDAYIIDATDSPLFQLQNQISEAGKFAWSYAGFDKLYQMLRLLIERDNPSKPYTPQNKKPYFNQNQNQNRGNYQQSRPSEMRGESSENLDGGDLFDTF